MESKLVRDDVRSNEEWFFYHWLLEAEYKNLVENIEYEAKYFILSPPVTVPMVKQLKTKTKTVDKHLFHKHYYTPDFTFKVVADILRPYFIDTLCQRTDYITTDVKGNFNPYGDGRDFPVNQKWTWDKFEVYVEKIVPDKLFKKTWCPEICRYSPVKKQPVKKYIGVKNISEFLAK